MKIKISRLSRKDVFQLTSMIDRQTAELAHLQFPFHKQAALNFIIKYNTWGLYLNGGVLVGAIEVKSSGETAYFVRKDFRGRGFATQGLQLIRNKFSDTELFCYIDQDNQASLKVAKKANIKINLI